MTPSFTRTTYRKSRPKSSTRSVAGSGSAARELRPARSLVLRVGNHPARTRGGLKSPFVRTESELLL